jgi:malonyl-CoA/methylmalonyl-CoA synthetase
MNIKGTTIPPLPLIARAEKQLQSLAIVDAEGEFTYGDLLQSSARVAACLLDGADDLRESRVVFMTPPGFEYAAVQWGIWRGGGIAVPLNISNPRPELEHVINDSGAKVIIGHPACEDQLRPIADDLGLRFELTSTLLNAEETPLPNVGAERRAMILYTSGTTGKPKGVVTTHRNIQSQVTSLISAWGWSAEDRILHVLPLHHVHGIVNVLSCSLWAGAVCEMLPRFDAEAVWQAFIEREFTLFMAVPTIYYRLIEAWEASSAARQKEMSRAGARLRLMVSGSAALPVSTLERWRDITGHTLLERYGMTEGGMFLSNPLHGERKPGYVGMPLPGVEARLVSEIGDVVEPGTPGEIQVRSPGVFLEYWNQPEATGSSFSEGWFNTGDVAVVEDGSYRILGRSSVDLIKTGGEKVFALEIEEVLRTHPDIRDGAIVGMTDPEWGELVCAALVLEEGCDLTLDDLRAWAKKRLAVAKVPKRMLVIGELPRNAMGKVSKPEVARLFERAFGVRHE